MMRFCVIVSVFLRLSTSGFISILFTWFTLVLKKSLHLVLFMKYVVYEALFVVLFSQQIFNKTPAMWQAFW